MLRPEEIHPMIVHFPIVFLLTLAAIDVVNAFRGRNLGDRSAMANVSAGLALLAGAASVAAYFFGDMAYDIAVDKGFPEHALQTHVVLGTTTAALLLIWALVRVVLWWRRVPLAAGRARMVALVEVAAALLVVVTAYYGGELVYGLGVNVVVAPGA